LLHEKFIKAFGGLSAKRQMEMIATLDEVAALLGGSDLDAAPILDVDAPVAGSK